MKKTIYSLFFACLLLVACSNDTSQENEANTDSNIDTSETTEEINVEKEEVIEEEVEVNEQQAETAKTTLTKDEFNQLFQLDPEEKQYENGQFELSDGSIVNADYLTYSGSEVFDYASTIFYENNLANIQLETDSTLEDIENALGITFDKATVEENRIGYEITFDEMFHEANISIYPFEMD